MPKNTFSEYAARQRPLVNKQIQTLLKRQLAVAHTQNAPYHDLVKQLNSLLMRGGKRLRPLLCLLAYEGYGGRTGAGILQVAASQELMHAFLLIHDDIIDRDYHRWGGQNILGIYFERYGQASSRPRDVLHDAEAQALLAGDICAAMAVEALQTSGFEPSLLVRAMHLQQQTALTVIGGEVADAAYPLARQLPTEVQVLRLYRDKTASYSLSLPLQLGALLAGAGQRELKLLNQFAENSGIAFQLQDDLLGMFGNEHKTGKPALSDLREGRRTVLMLYALKHATPTSRRQLLGVLGKESVDENDLQLAQTILIDTGARAYVEGLIQAYTEKSLKYLVKTGMSQTGQKRLIDLLALLVHRDH